MLKKEASFRRQVGRFIPASLQLPTDLVYTLLIEVISLVLDIKWLKEALLHTQKKKKKLASLHTNIFARKKNSS